jgi:hypothetical protein
MVLEGEEEEKEEKRLLRKGAKGGIATAYRYPSEEQQDA